jgi:hypothetical protein
MEWQTAFAILGSLCALAACIVGSHIADLRHRIALLENDGWSSQIMTWRQFVALPANSIFRGCPYWELGGEGPDRNIVVWTRTFIGRPDMKDLIP